MSPTERGPSLQTHHFGSGSFSSPTCLASEPSPKRLRTHIALSFAVVHPRPWFSIKALKAESQKFQKGAIWLRPYPSRFYSIIPVLASNHGEKREENATLHLWPFDRVLNEVGKDIKSGEHLLRIWHCLDNLA